MNMMTTNNYEARGVRDAYKRRDRELKQLNSNTKISSDRKAKIMANILNTNMSQIPHAGKSGTINLLFGGIGAAARLGDYRRARNSMPEKQSRKIVNEYIHGSYH